MGFKLCIIADDFTGACDSAVQFRRNRYSVFLGLDEWNSGTDLSSYDVLVLSTESRFMDNEAAYYSVRDTVKKCRSFNIDNFFKKIDSTIRGNIADEIAAVADELGYECVIVAPSAPKNNRTVVAGHCLVNGTPIGTATCLNDTFTPVWNSYIPALFEARFSGAVGLIDISQIRRGPAACKLELQRLRKEGMRIIITDAETIEDLRVIASLQDDTSILFSGASGLAEAMTRDESDSDITVSLPKVPKGEMLFVIGSISGTSREQLDRLKSTREIGILSLDIAQIFETENEELERLLSEAETLSKNIPIVIETLDKNGTLEDILNYAQARALSKKILGGTISAFLGRLVAEIIGRRTIQTLFVTGGDTAASVAESLGIKGIELLSEVLPGIPLGRFESALSSRTEYLISKAGGFGRPDTLERILELITERSTH